MMTATPNDVASLMFRSKHRIIAIKGSNIIMQAYHHITEGDTSLTHKMKCDIIMVYH